MKEIVHVDCRHAIAYKADAGQASPAAATAVKGLVWYGCWGSMDLPPAAFLSKVGAARVLKDGDNLMDGAVLGLTVSSKCRPMVVVNVASTKGLREGFFKTFLSCSSVTVASGKFTIQGYFGLAIPAPHFGDMLCPS